MTRRKTTTPTTSAAPPDLASLLPSIPKDLVVEMAKAHDALQRAASEGNYDRVELAGGKLCEALMRSLEWKASGGKSYTPLNRPLSNFEKQARSYESNTALPDSLRFHVPQTMVAVYTVRNRRGVSHVGGEVDPNRMDASFVVAASSWLLAELVRLEGDLVPAVAQSAIERLTERHVPLVWEHGDVLRVLDPHLSHKDQTLALLYAKYPDRVSEASLVHSIEPSNPSVYRRDVLRPAHKKRLLEYDEKNKQVLLTPLGLRYVEEELELWAP